MIIFPIRTPLSHFIVSPSSATNINCYIEVREAVSLDAETFLTDSDKDIIRQAVGKMTIPVDGVLKIQIHLQKPESIDDIRGLGQVKQDSTYHRDAIEFLKSLGFKKVVMDVNCASIIHRSAYE